MRRIIATARRVIGLILVIATLYIITVAGRMGIFDLYPPDTRIKVINSSSSTISNLILLGGRKLGEISILAPGASAIIYFPIKSGFTLQLDFNSPEGHKSSTELGYFDLDTRGDAILEIGQGYEVTLHYGTRF